MSTDPRDRDQRPLTRRGFLRATGALAALAGGTAAGCGTPRPEPETTPSPELPDADQAAHPNENEGQIIRHHTLGRTGFQVSDISMGCGRIADSNVVRYVYDHGVNYFDTAESYGDGDSERKLGEAMPHLDRDKIFITTKLIIDESESEQSILERFGKCLERMRTDHADALYTHAVTRTSQVTHAGFHGAIAKLKADSRVRHAGISCHGPRSDDQHQMSDVLLAAAQDGRFDLMLLVYNFMNKNEGELVLAACKEKNIGTTCMKAYAGKLAHEPLDPDNPSEGHARLLKILVGRGKTREEAIAYLQEFVDARAVEIAELKPKVDAFVAAHGITNQLELDRASIQWVLRNPDMHTVCVAMPDFDRAAKIIPLSGTQLTAAGARLLDDYATAFGNSYCRHGCNTCLSRCPNGVPVNTIMRYTYYFSCAGRERYAMERYARLGQQNGVCCITCEAPCELACPHGVPVQTSLLRAHAMLTVT